MILLYEGDIFWGLEVLLEGSSQCWKLQEEEIGNMVEILLFIVFLVFLLCVFVFFFGVYIVIFCWLGNVVIYYLLWLLCEEDVGVIFQKWGLFLWVMEVWSVIEDDFVDVVGLDVIVYFYFFIVGNYVVI